MRIISEEYMGAVNLIIQADGETAISYLGEVSEDRTKVVCERLVKAWKRIKPCKSINHKAIYLKSIADNMSRSK